MIATLIDALEAALGEINEDLAILSFLGTALRDRAELPETEAACLTRPWNSGGRRWRPRHPAIRSGPGT